MSPTKIIWRKTHQVQLLFYLHKDHWDKLPLSLGLTVTFIQKSSLRGVQGSAAPWMNPGLTNLPHLIAYDVIHMMVSSKRCFQDPDSSLPFFIHGSMSQEIFVTRLPVMPIHCGYDLLQNLRYFPWKSYWSIWFLTCIFPPLICSVSGVIKC